MSFTRIEGLSNSRQHASPVTPADDADLPQPGLVIIGTAGNLKVTTVNGEIVTFPIATGVPVYLSIQKVFATGTTATNLVIFF